MTNDVLGPVSSLAGAAHKLPNGTTCDEHPDRPAVAAIQGETDSFGCEVINCCEGCKMELLSAIRADTKGVCHWCHKQADDLMDHRDFEEGRSGRVYRVCQPCRTAERERHQIELDDQDDWIEDDAP